MLIVPRYCGISKVALISVVNLITHVHVSVLLYEVLNIILIFNLLIYLSTSVLTYDESTAKLWLLVVAGTKPGASYKKVLCITTMISPHSIIWSSKTNFKWTNQHNLWTSQLTRMRSGVRWWCTCFSVIVTLHKYPGSRTWSPPATEVSQTVKQLYRCLSVSTPIYISLPLNYSVYQIK